MLFIIGLCFAVGYAVSQILFSAISGVSFSYTRIQIMDRKAEAVSQTLCEGYIVFYNPTESVITVSVALVRLYTNGFSKSTTLTLRNTPAIINIYPGETYRYQFLLTGSLSKGVVVFHVDVSYGNYVYRDAIPIVLS